MDVFERLAAIEAERVLDVGAGLGGSIARLLAHLGRCGHVTDPAAVLAEMRRVLEPGGRLIVAEPHTGTTSEARRTDVLVHGWRARTDTMLGVRHNQTFTREALVALVAGLGLSDLEVLDYMPNDRDRTAPRSLEEIGQYQARLDGVVGAQAARLREEGRSLEERVRRTGVEAAPALLILGRA